MQPQEVGLQYQLGIPDQMFDNGPQPENLHPDRKSRAAKKRDKIEKRLKRFEDPQFKLAERQKKRKRAKQKLKRETVGMDKQQTYEYVQAIKQKKAKLKEKMFEAVKTGLPILVDFVYQQHMNNKQRTSLAVQIELIYKAMRHVEHPCSLHLCSLGGTIEESLKGMRYEFWPMTSHKQDVVEVGKKLGRQLIYLSPDAEQTLKEVDPTKAYIIGGLVDRTIIKNASLKRAQYLGVKAAKLPIEQMMVNRKCLNLDHVSLMLVKYLQTKDWVKSFEFAAPKRFKKQQQEQSADQPVPKQQSLSSSSESDSDDQQEQPPPTNPLPNQPSKQSIQQTKQQ